MGLRKSIKKPNSNRTASTAKQQKRHAPAKNTMVFEQEDIELIYRALRAYKPRENEANLLSIWIEAFEEVLAVDFLEVDYYGAD